MASLTKRIVAMLGEIDWETLRFGDALQLEQGGPVYVYIGANDGRRDGPVAIKIAPDGYSQTTHLMTFIPTWRKLDD